MRRYSRRPADRVPSAPDWTAAGGGDAAGGRADVIEGGGPSWNLHRLPGIPRVVGVVVAIAVAAGGTALVWRALPADDIPSLAVLGSPPSASSGLLHWAPRGELVKDEGFVREALQTLRSSGLPDRPRTGLHLVYAGGSVVLFQGDDRSHRPALAQVLDGEVVVDRLREREPVALTLPAGRELRFLVPPAARSATRPTEVWVRDAAEDPSGGFRRLPADDTGLTEEFEAPPGATRFLVMEPRVTETGMTSGDQLRGDGLAHVGSLLPAVPAVRLTGSPWAVEGDPYPSRQWLTDAELLAASLPVGGAVRVASLTGGGGFTPGPPRPDGKVYSDGLYAVSDGSGKDYLGYVLRLGDQALCSRVTGLRGRFADLLVVGGRCNLPGESVEAVSVITRPDVRRGEIRFSPTAGHPTMPLTGGSALVTFAEPSQEAVTLTAATGRSSATYVIPPG